METWSPEQGSTRSTVDIAERAGLIINNHSFTSKSRRCADIQILKSTWCNHQSSPGCNRQLASINPRWLPNTTRFLKIDHGIASESPDFSLCIISNSGSHTVTDRFVTVPFTIGGSGMKMRFSAEHSTTWPVFPESSFK